MEQETRGQIIRDNTIARTTTAKSTMEYVCVYKYK